MQGWPSDLNPPAVGSVAVDSHPRRHGGWNGGAGHRAERLRKRVRKVGKDNDIWRLLHQ